MRGRFAPSPTGPMHLGNARTALAAWLQARAAGGAFVLRVEDLDRTRVRAEHEARLLDDLAWLGFDWDEGPDRGGPHVPYRQSERAAAYDAAVASLLTRGHAFPCACSRADVTRAASAPHPEDEDGPRYPGTCRDQDPTAVAARARAHGREPSVRFHGGARAPFDDLLCGRVDPLGAVGVDDFVLRRADGVAAYQLAVVVDDAAMAISHVVRGADLLRSTPRQLAVFRALGRAPPAYLHVPLVLTPGGDRLAKRTRPWSLADLRRAGVDAETIVGALAASLGLCQPGIRLRPPDLVDAWDVARLPHEPAAVIIPGV